MKNKPVGSIYRSGIYAILGECCMNVKAEVASLSEIARLASECRILQKAYFRDRRPSDLNAAKEMERRLDKALAELREGPGLFD